MSIQLKCKATKLIHQDGDFYIYGMSPIHPYPKELQLSEYFTFTCKGYGLSWISLNREYEIEIEEFGYDKKGITNYKIIAVPSIDYHKLENLSYDESMEILSEITTSSQAKYLLDAYDNFVWLALTEGKEAIDTSKIYNVGEFRINCYLRELNVKYKYLNIQSKFKEYKIDIPDCKKLCDKYKDEDGIRKAIEDNPYFVNIEVLERGFENSDKLIMEVRSDLKESKIRCEALMVHVLKLNESQSGNTLLHGNILYLYMKDEYDVEELLGMVKEVAMDSELIYYNEKTSNLTLMSTYIGECKVANFVKDKIRNNKKLDIDHTKYTKIKDGTLTDEQSNILKTICDSNIAIINSRGGTGKAQPVDTIIPTPNGKKKLGDLKIGDYVYDRLGNPTKILDIFPQGLKDCYEVTLKDGRTTICNDEHLWSYYTDRGKFKTETLKQMMNRPLKKIEKRGYRYKIPTNEPIEKEELELPIDPYILGCFIGNGCCRSSILTISTNDEENVLKISNILNCTYKKVSSKNYSWGFYNIDGTPIYTRNIVPMLLDKYSYEKEIPQIYLEGSINQRFELLRGLLDTDGSIMNRGKRFSVRYSTTSEKLKNNVVDLIFGLGMTATVREDKRDKYTTGVCYSINILCDNDKKEHLFTLSRKKEIAQKSNGIFVHKRYDRTEIVDIQKLDIQKEMMCILVDNEEHLYLTNDYIVTHNTSVLCATVEMFEDNNLSYLLLSPTGRVANKITEQTNGRKAQTIHKACLSCGESGLWVDVIFVEEYSMVSLDLMCMLINSISNPDCRIYFNGHLGQIAPIGIGCPMRDMIDSGIVPTCSLSRVFRYGEGGLYKMATDADDGKFYIGQLDYENKDRVSIGENKDYTYVRYNGKVEQIIEEYSRFIKRGIKPIDIAVITLWNVTDFGCINLSNKIQEVVNPSMREGDFVEKKIRGYNVKFKVQDLIMNTKNCYSVVTLDSYKAMQKDKRLTKEDVNTVVCMNGEVGKIIDIENGNIVAKFNEELLVFDKSLQDNLLLSYSCTSYKLQGSDCPYIITLVTPQFKKSLDKNLIYTDMSRARKEVVEIIDPTTLAEAITIDSTQKRKTNLKELLLDGN